jgi:glycosyltransferase involved in cell wall biosynthesis
MTVNVLIVNHTALMSGAEATTLELLRERQDEFRYWWACPPGGLADAARELGAPFVPLRGTAGSLRLSPRDTPVALAELAVMGVQVRRASARHRIQLIHAVSMRAGIVAAISRRLGGPPFLLYQHDVAPPGRVGAAIRALVDPVAGRLAACSRHILDGLRREGWRAPGEVVPEPVDLAPYRAAAAADGVRAELAPGPGPLVAEVAQITPWKGQDTAIRAMAEVRRRHPGARLAIVGDITFASRATRFDNHAYLASLKRLVAELGLEDAVVFAGRRADMPAVMRSVDALLLPSWEEPLGRVVAEAMAAGTPVVATSVGGPAETIEDGVDGLLAPPRDPAAWAAAICRLLDDPEAARRMGERAGTAVERFELPRFHAAMRAAHRAALRPR